MFTAVCEGRNYHIINVMKHVCHTKVVLFRIFTSSDELDPDDGNEKRLKMAHKMGDGSSSSENEKKKKKKKKKDKKKKHKKEKKKKKDKKKVNKKVSDSSSDSNSEDEELSWIERRSK